MDICKRSKSISITNMLTATLLLLIITPVLHATSNTFSIGEIDCSCSGTSADCSGNSDEIDEIEQVLSLLLNCSSPNDLLDLTLKIENVEKLPNKSFNHFKLKNLTLGYGLLMLDHDAFYGLNSTLTSLNMSHNDIEFFILKHSPFSILENLMVLNLDFNNLPDFQDSIFENLTKLEVLSISGNSFTGLQANLLENMTAIQTLIMDHNRNVISLSDLNIVSSTLINLSAKNCSINGSLESDSLSGIANLKNADFSSNKLTQVNAYALDKLHNLETLNLNNNKIETLKNYSFSSLHNLVVLDLKGNGIKEIEEFSFVNLTQLKILNLANNQIYGFSKNYALDLHSLEKINLEKNNIHYVEFGSFSVCIQLKELLLRGNAFDCWHCDTMYIVGLLTNDTLFQKEEADAITCDEPDEMKDMPVAEVTPEQLEDSCDPVDSTSEPPSTSISTTEKTTTEFTPAFSTEVPASNSSSHHTEDPSSTYKSTLSEDTDTSVSTTINMPTNTSESTDTTYETTTPFITSSTTTKTSSRIIPEPTDVVTEVTTLFSESTTETNVTTELTTVFLPESKVTEKTEIDTTTDTITEHTTVGNIGVFNQSTSELTTQSTTEKIDETTISNTTEMITSINKTEATIISVTTTQHFSSLSSVTTELSTVSSSETELNREGTSQLSTVRSTQADFASTDSSEPTTGVVVTKKVSESQMIRIIDYSVSNDTICVKWDMKWDILNKQWLINDLKCGVEIQHLNGKELGYFKNCPNSEDEIKECTIIENKYLNNMYKFCLNVYISIFKKLRSCSKYHSVSTTEKSLKQSSTTNLPMPKSTPPTEVTFLPFKVVKFDATFNYKKSFVDVSWVVNRNEKNSICSLNLILMSHNFNYTEGVFSCKNNSYKIQNIKHGAFQVCLRNFYQGYYAPLWCKSSVPLSSEFKASSMKDDGYKNSALIAVICLLILIVLIVIVILLKKLLKKRSESDLYNVSAEEKNVLRRQTSSSFQREPCVRYSYTLREQMEI